MMEVEMKEIVSQFWSDDKTSAADTQKKLTALRAKLLHSTFSQK
jgi:hypothetical protein